LCAQVLHTVPLRTEDPISEELAAEQAKQVSEADETSDGLMHPSDRPIDVQVGWLLRSRRDQ
jgi:hypothetical protein